MHKSSFISNLPPTLNSNIVLNVTRIHTKRKCRREWRVKNMCKQRKIDIKLTIQVPFTLFTCIQVSFTNSHSYTFTYLQVFTNLQVYIFTKHSQIYIVKSIHIFTYLLIQS